MSRSSPAPRGFRGTPTLFRVGQNIFDGRHSTPFACSEQRTELRCPFRRIPFLLRGPSSPYFLLPLRLEELWQVLRELRETLCQRFSRLLGPEGEITNFCPVWCHLSTIFSSEQPHTNYLVARFPQLSRPLRLLNESFWALLRSFDRPGAQVRVNYEAVICSSQRPCA